MTPLYLIVTLSAALSCPRQAKVYSIPAVGGISSQEAVNYTEPNGCSCTTSKSVRFTFDRVVAEAALGDGAQVFAIPQNRFPPEAVVELKRESKTTYSVSETPVEAK